MTLVIYVAEPNPKKDGPENKESHFEVALILSGAPGEIRTPDLLVRSQTLYPTELRALARRRIIVSRGPNVNS